MILVVPRIGTLLELADSESRRIRSLHWGDLPIQRTPAAAATQPFSESELVPV